MLRLFALWAVAAVGVVVISGCAIVASPVAGALYTEAKYGDTATSSTGASKEGRACATSILGLVATGDASIATAKAAGGISEVSSVDHTAKNILGILGEWCTVVKGK
jgi:hypothetical protein